MKMKKAQNIILILIGAILMPTLVWGADTSTTETSDGAPATEVDRSAAEGLRERQVIKRQEKNDLKATENEAFPFIQQK